MSLKAMERRNKPNLWMFDNDDAKDLNRYQATLVFHLAQPLARGWEYLTLSASVCQVLYCCFSFSLSSLKHLAFCTNIAKCLAFI